MLDHQVWQDGCQRRQQPELPHRRQRPQTPPALAHFSKLVLLRAFELFGSSWMFPRMKARMGAVRGALTASDGWSPACGRGRRSGRA